MVDDRDFRRAANVLLKLTKHSKKKPKISSQDNGPAAPIVNPPVIASGSFPISERVVPIGDRAPLETSGNILEGDLAQLAEKLHGLDRDQLRQFVSDLHAAFREVASEIDPRLPAFSEPSADVQHAVDEKLSEPSGPLEESQTISAAAVSLPDVAEPATNTPEVIDPSPLPLTPGTQHSPTAVGPRWIRRIGLWLCLAVFITLVWVLPSFYTNRPHWKAPNSDAVPKLNALAPSHGNQIPEGNIAPIDVATTPAPQLSKIPDETVREITSPEATADRSAQSLSSTTARADITALLDRADQLLRHGDIVAARSFYELAAASGSARAATGVARTFDPAFLSQLGVVGVRGDAERAAIWYQKANEAAKSTSDIASPQSDTR